MTNSITDFHSMNQKELKIFELFITEVCIEKKIEKEN